MGKMPKKEGAPGGNHLQLDVYGVGGFDFNPKEPILAVHVMDRFANTVTIATTEANAEALIVQFRNALIKMREQRASVGLTGQAAAIPNGLPLMEDVTVGVTPDKQVFIKFETLGGLQEQTVRLTPQALRDLHGSIGKVQAMPDEKPN